MNLTARNNLNNLSMLMARYALDMNDIAEIAGCTAEEAEQYVYHRKMPSEAVYEALARYFQWDSPELKPCPFCGGKAELFGTDSDQIFYVECMECEVSSNFDTAEEAIEAWNRRAGRASSRYFSNSGCEYYPCHAGAYTENFNCLFCYCPLYPLPDCGGKPTYLPNGIKDCTNCLLPHENYEAVIARLRKEMLP